MNPGKSSYSGKGPVCIKENMEYIGNEDEDLDYEYSEDTDSLVMLSTYSESEISVTTSVACLNRNFEYEISKRAKEPGNVQRKIWTMPFKFSAHLPISNIKSSDSIFIPSPNQFAITKHHLLYPSEASKRRKLLQGTTEEEEEIDDLIDFAVVFDNDLCNTNFDKQQETTSNLNKEQNLKQVDNIGVFPSSEMLESDDSFCFLQDEIMHVGAVPPDKILEQDSPLKRTASNEVVNIDDDDLEQNLEDEMLISSPNSDVQEDEDRSEDRDSTAGNESDDSDIHLMVETLEDNAEVQNKDSFLKSTYDSLPTSQRASEDIATDLTVTVRNDYSDDIEDFTVMVDNSENLAADISVPDYTVTIENDSRRTETEAEKLTSTSDDNLEAQQNKRRHEDVVNDKASVTDSGPINADAHQLIETSEDSMEIQNDSSQSLDGTLTSGDNLEVQRNEKRQKDVEIDKESITEPKRVDPYQPAETSGIQVGNANPPIKTELVSDQNLKYQKDSTRDLTTGSNDTQQVVESFGTQDNKVPVQNDNSSPESCSPRSEVTVKVESEDSDSDCEESAFDRNEKFLRKLFRPPPENERLPFSYDLLWAKSPQATVEDKDTDDVSIVEENDSTTPKQDVDTIDLTLADDDDSSECSIVGTSILNYTCTSQKEFQRNTEKVEHLYVFKGICLNFFKRRFCSIITCNLLHELPPDFEKKLNSLGHLPLIKSYRFVRESNILKYCFQQFLNVFIKKRKIDMLVTMIIDCSLVDMKLVKSVIKSLEAAGLDLKGIITMIIQRDNVDIELSDFLLGVMVKESLEDYWNLIMVLIDRRTKPLPPLIANNMVAVAVSDFIRNQLLCQRIKEEVFGRNLVVLDEVPKFLLNIFNNFTR